MKKNIVTVVTVVIAMVMILSVSVSALNCSDYAGEMFEENFYYEIDSNDIWYYDARSFVLEESLMLRKEVKRDPCIDRDGNILDDWNIYYCDFLGEDEVTRSYISALLHRYNGSKETIYTVWGSKKVDKYNFTTFVDIPKYAWYIPSAQWAYENGIINGVGGAYFAPDRTITREEFAAMLYRYTNYLEVDTTARVDYSDYADSESVSDWAHDAMSWAVAEGLINGKPGKLLAPQDTITRAEVATVIYRFNNEVKAHRDIWDGKS